MASVTKVFKTIDFWAWMMVRMGMQVPINMCLFSINLVGEGTI
jgi:hypothetical protein